MVRAVTWPVQIQEIERDPWCEEWQVTLQRNPGYRTSRAVVVTGWLLMVTGPRCISMNVIVLDTGEKVFQACKCIFSFVFFPQDSSILICTLYFTPWKKSFRISYYSQLRFFSGAVQINGLILSPC